MKKLSISFLVIIAFVFTANAQEVVSFQGFEQLENGTDILKLQKAKFGAWGKSAWTVTEKKGKGFNNSDKFASSGEEENATLVQYKDLEVGVTYVFSVAVKAGNADKPFKANYSVKAVSGKKGDMHFYGKEEMKEPAVNKWKKHELEFTVIEGRERVVLQVYRWAKGVTLHVDDFKLVKK